MSEPPDRPGDFAITRPVPGVAGMACSLLVLAVDKAGALLVADDVGGIVWRAAPASAPSP